jgi:ubiquinone/menaquinone biosynthesis C-methylase UbiE
VNVHDRRFTGDITRLRTPERLARLEVERVVGLSLEGGRFEAVLDIGVGSGVFAEAFAARGLQVSGIDVNPEMIATAIGYVPQGYFELAAAESIPFPDASFDLAFMGLSLHETDDRLKALQEARRVTRRRLAILEWPFEEGPVGPPLAHRIPPDTLLENFKQAGFTKVQQRQLTQLVFYWLE